MAAVLSKYVPGIQATAEVTGGSVANLQLINTGKPYIGMTITLDWTGAATQLTVNGKPAGKPIAGEDFYRALLRIWLGDKPVQNDLKKSLLGA